MAAPSPSASDAIDAGLIARFRADYRAAAGEALTTDAPLAVAVSGGPDSMALLALAHAGFPGRAVAATFDHRLRPGSADEAATVAAWCDARGIAHATLAPLDPLPRSGVQARARAARYAALECWAVEVGATTLATAHHADDQAETLLMRANRAAGVAGLAAIRRRRVAAVGTDGDGVRPFPLAIVRPLLGWRRAELASLTAALALPTTTDPANADDRYDRARLRKALAAADWLDAAALARSAAALAEAETALAWTADRLTAERCTVTPEGLALDPRGLPAELLRRLVLAVLARIDSEAPPPAGPALARFCEALGGGDRAMLGAVLADARGGRWHFRRAPPRRHG